MACWEDTVFLICIMILHNSHASPLVPFKTNHPFSSRIQIKTVPLTCVQKFEDKIAHCQRRHLKEVPQDLYPDTQKLILWMNDLSALHNTSFQQYAQLTELDLSSNHIQNIECGTFYPLKHLRKLILSGIPNLKFSAEIVRWSAELQELNLGGGTLKLFPSTTMEFLPNLASLYLGENKLTSINITMCSSNNINSINLFRNTITTITREAFMFDCPTYSLSIKDNPIEVIDPQTIASLPIRVLSLGGYFLSEELLGNLFKGVSGSLIEELWVEDTGITNIPRDLFAPLHNKSLSKLSLSGNRLVLYPSVFANLTHVSALYLGNCHLELIEPNFFDGMTGLRFLNLDFSSIKDLNPSGMMWKINLHELHLSENKFREINEFAFRGLHNLTTLVINDINLFLIFIPPSATPLHIYVDNLQSLRMSGIVELRRLNTPLLKRFSCGTGYRYPTWVCNYKGTFKDATSLEQIDMSYAGLHELTTLHSSDRVSLFHRLYNLNSLDISGNYLHKLPSGIFRNSTLLQELKIRDNFIQMISSNAFAGLVSLQTLDLSENRIVYISTTFLRDLKELKNLHIESNALSYLDEDLFAASPVLANLTFTNNRFVSFNHSTFRQIYSSIRYVDISGNELICNCDSRWLIDDLLRFLHHEDQTICSNTSATLQPLRAKPLTLFKPSAYCRTNIASYCLIFASVLVLIVTFVLFYYNRWLLRYKLFLFKLAILGYREIKDAQNREDFEYDINVMFIDDDNEWADQILRPAFEERLPNYGRVAFGDEDLLLGRHYFDAVYYNVERSFKTVLLVSRAAVLDHIFMTKFRIAINYVTETERECMLVVFLEDIPDEEFPYLVRLYLSGQGAYLHWQEDEEGQEYFKNKLIKHLSVNLRINQLVPLE